MPFTGESKACLVGMFIYDCPSHYCVRAAWLACIVCELILSSSVRRLEKVKSFQTFLGSRSQVWVQQLTFSYVSLWPGSFQCLLLFPSLGNGVTSLITVKSEALQKLQALNVLCWPAASIKIFFQYEEMSRNEAPILMALCGDQKDQWSQVLSPNSQQILAFLMNEGQNS